MNRQYLLNARPVGDIKYADFELVEREMPVAGDGEVLIKTLYLAVEPAMRGWMENRSDYVAPLALGDVMRGYCSGEVIESNNAEFPVGARVAGSFGWQEYVVSDGTSIPLQKIADDIDLPAAMGLLGVTGLTAYFGLKELGAPKQGDVVLVSGAAGATGSVVVQLAKIAGCHVVGIAGSAEKCRWVSEELGADATINYRQDDVKAEVAKLCPDGINIYYDNVGGEILDIALANIALNARVVICGGISRYNLTGEIPGPKNYFNLVFRRARMEGFIVGDYAARFGEASAEILGLLREGKLKHHETILDGFEKMPDALMGLFSGANMGKQLVRTSTGGNSG
jgi:NADPH-dependent curcumin reductase CurA